MMPHVLGTLCQFFSGVGDAALENISMGMLHPKEDRKWTLGYKAGRLSGDAIGIAAGRGLFLAGTGLEASGVVASVGSGGVLAAAGIPISAGGLVLATAGTAVAAKSAISFMADASHPIKGEINPCDKKINLRQGLKRNREVVVRCMVGLTL